MARLKKRGASGQAKNFITRTQAIRKLQISLPDFRRLCIFKGIYPREPRNKKKASKSSTPSTTFYYTKDVQYLLHEPLLTKFRDHKALSKKIARSLGRGEVGDAVRLEKTGTQKVSLDHIVKERYPTFLDAIRDLDDALSLLFLFANLPSTANVPPKTIRLCQKLCHEFQHYIILSHSLRKSFLSIKGIYYQATVQGQDIMWLVPYKFVQRVTGDVDFRIMGTFIEFYTTLLGFVNFRLYSSLGLVYPPKFNSKSDERGGELGAFTLEGISVGKDGNADADRLLHNISAGGKKDDRQDDTSADVQLLIDEGTKQDTDHRDTEDQPEIDDQTRERASAIDKFEVMGDGADILAQPNVGTSEASMLLAETHFFISREAPRQALEFVLKSFGCKRVSWPDILGDGAFTNNENDTTITHQIIDRPLSSLVNDPNAEPTDQSPNRNIIPGRTYVQPQWVWDCINTGKLLRPDLYAPGAILPPHLSPWVKAKAGVYDPTLPLDEQAPEGEAEEFAQNSPISTSDNQETAMLTEPDDLVDGNGIPSSDGFMIEHGMLIAGEDDGVSGESENEEEFEGFGDTNGDGSKTENPDFLIHQIELEAEASGRGVASDIPGNITLEQARQQRKQEKRRAQEDTERRLGMTSRKKRKLYEKMMHGRRRQDEQNAILRQKRRRLEAKTV